jgi:hypothetical protein
VVSEGAFRKATPDDNNSSVVLFNPTQRIALKPHEGFWFYRDLIRTESDVEAPVVFVGYGIKAPELNYDDYAGTDALGKIVASINNAPATFPTSPAAYYTNHVQKMSAAVDHGAIGFLMIRLPGDDTDPAGTGEWLKSDGSPQDTFPQIRAWAELRQAAAEILMQVHPNHCPKFSLLLGLASISHFRLPGQRECIPSTFIRGLRPQMWLGRSLVLIRNCETNL